MCPFSTPIATGLFLFGVEKYTWISRLARLQIYNHFEILSDFSNKLFRVSANFQPIRNYFEQAH